MAILQAYFDESERDGGVFCIAGYLFAPAQAKKFCRDWRKLMGPLLPAHMTDLATGGGIYQRLSKQRREALVQGAVKIINKRVSHGIVISCNVREVEQQAPSWIHGLRFAYSLCCHIIMMRVRARLQEIKSQDRVAYVFESGHHHQGEANELITLVPPAYRLEVYRYYSHSFQPKEDFPPLQAADLLAWEWTKFMDETHGKRIRPTRRSLASLILSQPGRYVGNHLTGTPLVRYMKAISKLGLG